MRILILLMISISALAQMTNTQKQDVPFVSIIPNSGFENGRSGYVSSGGTFASVTSGSNLLSGLSSVTWDSNAASQTLRSPQVAIPEGLKGKNGQLFCSFKPAATGATHVLELWDGTNASYGQTIRTVDTSTALTTSTNFVFPTSGNIGWRVRSVASNEPLIAIDDCYLGPATNLTNVAQNALVVSAFKAGTANCAWARTNAAYGDFGTDADCPAVTVVAQGGICGVTTADDDLPQIVLTDCPAGNYKVTFSFRSNPSGATYTGLALSDGTDRRGEVIQTINGTDSNAVTLVGVFSYGTSGSRTFRLQGYANSGTVNLQNNTTGTQGEALTMLVERLPSASEIVATINNVPWYVDVNIGGANPSLGNAAVSTYTEITNGSLDLVTNSGSLAAQIPCSGTNASTGATCSSGNESVGVVFNLPIPGAVEACVYGTTQHSWSNSATLTAYQIVETPNNAQTILQEGNSRVQTGTEDQGSGTNILSFSHCSIMRFSSAGQKTLRLMYEQVVAGPGTIIAPAVFADRNAAYGNRDIRWTVKPVNQMQPVPVLVGGVSTALNGQARIEYVSFGGATWGTNACTASPCTIASQSGAASSVTRSSTGTYVVNWASGTWAQGPSCSVSCVGASFETRMLGVPAGVLSTSTLNIDSHSVAGGGVPPKADTSCNVICMGPR